MSDVYPTLYCVSDISSAFNSYDDCRKFNFMFGETRDLEDRLPSYNKKGNKVITLCEIANCSVKKYPDITKGIDQWLMRQDRVLFNRNSECFVVERFPSEKSSATYLRAVEAFVGVVRKYCRFDLIKVLDKEAIDCIFREWRDEHRLIKRQVPNLRPLERKPQWHGYHHIFSVRIILSQIMRNLDYIHVITKERYKKRYLMIPNQEFTSHGDIFDIYCEPTPEDVKERQEKYPFCFRSGNPRVTSNNLGCYETDPTFSRYLTSNLDAFMGL